MEHRRKLFLYIAMSLDGYIAGENGDMSFLSAVSAEGEDYGYRDFIETVDTVIIGRKTYDWVMTQVHEFPHKDLKTYVITSKPRPAEGKTEFYGGSLKDLAEGLKAVPGKNIFCDGGGETVHTLLENELIDEMIISIVPVLLGNGIRLFRRGEPRRNLELITAKHFASGLVQLHYRKS